MCPIFPLSIASLHIFRTSLWAHRTRHACLVCRSLCGAPLRPAHRWRRSEYYAARLCADSAQRLRHGVTPPTFFSTATTALRSLVPASRAPFAFFGGPSAVMAPVVSRACSSKASCRYARSRCLERLCSVRVRPLTPTGLLSLDALSLVLISRRAPCPLSLPTASRGLFAPTSGLRNNTSANSADG